MQDVPISEIMNRHVVCGKAGDHIEDIVRIMVEKKYSSVVINDAKRPIGIITERDIVRLMNQFHEDVQEKTIADVMTSSLICVHEDDTLLQVLELSTKKKIKHFPIINQLDELEGLVTQSDLVAHYLKNMLSYAAHDSITAELIATNQELKAMALEDPLLGIGNRRAMELELERTHSQFLRYGVGYAVALFDIDYFKKYNDHFGHVAGDFTLRRVAETLNGVLRKTDCLFRYGGEELLALLPQTDLENAKIVVHRMGEAVINLQIPHPDSPLRIVSISGGLCHCDESKKETLDWRQVVSEADDYLYQAKENGRNRIESE